MYSGIFMTSTLIATDEVEEIVQSGLQTRALDHVIDAADASIVDLYGAHSGERTVTLRGNRSLPQRQRLGHIGLASQSYQSQSGYYSHGGGEWRVHLPYPWAETVAGVSEYAEHEGEAGAETVDASRWALELGGRALRRLDRPWRSFVVVRYTPIDDRAKRVLLLVDLVKLSTRYDATARTQVGPGGAGVAVQHLDYESERKKLLHRLMPNRPGSMMA